MAKFLDDTGLQALINKIKSALNNKVDKIDGKGLSTNDFTTTLKNKLDAISSQANKTTVSDGNSTGGNGTITVTTDGTTTYPKVYGLKSAAYTESSAYATSAQGTKADNAMPKSGGTFTGNVSMASGKTLTVNTPSSDSHAATKKYVDDKIAAADAMVYKGTVGTNGTVSTLPTSGVVVGDTYKVITPGTYASQSAKVGDLFIAQVVSGTETQTITWDYIPSGNENETSIRYSTTASEVNVTTTAGYGSKVFGAASIKQVDTSISAASTSENLPTSKAVASFVEGKGYTTNIGTVTGVTAGTGLSGGGTSGTFTINHSNSITAGSQGEDGSTRTLAFGGTFKVPKIAYDAQGHIVTTGTSTITLTMPAAPTASSLGAITSITKSNGITGSKSGTVETISADIDTDGGIAWTGSTDGSKKIAAALSSYTKNSSAIGGKLYAVQLDKNGKLAVNVPWTDNDHYVTGAAFSYDTSTANQPKLKLTLTGNSGFTAVNATVDLVISDDIDAMWAGTYTA